MLMSHGQNNMILNDIGKPIKALLGDGRSKPLMFLEVWKPYTDRSLQAVARGNRRPYFHFVLDNIDLSIDSHV